jgi:hypothetical protein
LSAYKEWESKTQEIIDVQIKWKEIGFAPKKQNTKIFGRFRKACDKFFEEKNEFFAQAKSELNENLEKKIKLCEQAEAMKDSTDWKKMSDKFIKLQKEWKEIGTVPRKQSDIVWKRFIAACDYFFEQRDKSGSDERTEQNNNLEKKQEIIAQIEALDTTQPQEQAFQKLKSLIADFHAVGFVPYKVKDKVQKAFKAAIDAKFDALKLDAKSRVKSMLDDASENKHRLFREREKLLKELDHLKSEVATYENNIGFFSASKKADSFIKEMEKRIQKLKKEKEQIFEAIQAIEAKL